MCGQKVRLQCTTAIYNCVCVTNSYTIAVGMAACPQMCGMWTESMIPINNLCARVSSFCTTAVGKVASLQACGVRVENAACNSCVRVTNKHEHDCVPPGVC